MGKKKDIQQFDSICTRHKMTDEEAWAFSDCVHGLKASGTKGSGTGGNFTYQELDQLAREFLGLPGGENEE
jgi:hypothetical protein